MKRGEKWLNAKLEHHMAELYALLHEVSAFIYIIIYYRWVSFAAIGSKSCISNYKKKRRKEISYKIFCGGDTLYYM